MKDNISAFSSSEYDTKIKQTIPFYEVFYEQIIELVKAYYEDNALTWLDVGCGTGKMADMAFTNVELEKFVFCDCSEKMIEIVKERFPFRNAEYIVCDVQELPYSGEFDVITTIQVNHYLQEGQRKYALKKYYEALKKNGLYISFENFAPFTDDGRCVYLKRWKSYQIESGKSMPESEEHIARYGKEYYPVSVTENLKLMRECGFKTVEILWLSNMQIGIWGIK